MKLRVCLLTYFERAFAVTALATALQQRGHVCDVVSPRDCSVTISAGPASIQIGNRQLDGYDTVLTRCVAYFHQGRLTPRNLEAAVATALVQRGARALNQPSAKLLANDKILSLMALSARGLPVPPTLVSLAPGATANSDTTLPAVLKVPEGLQGAGVMRVDSAVSLKTVTEAFHAQGIPLVIQPDVAQPGSRQLRVLVLGDRALAAYAATPAPWDFRANIHAGATPTPVPVTAEMELIAVQAARALDLELAGVDLIWNPDGPLILEVNPAPGFEVATNLCGVDVAAAIVDYLQDVAMHPTSEGPDDCG